MASKQLIACMTKAKGDKKKMAACRASFAKHIPRETPEQMVLKDIKSRSKKRKKVVSFNPLAKTNWPK